MPRSLEAAGSSAFPGFTMRLLARARSTQDVVMAAARDGASEGFCCVAAEQTAGRGRRGRRWTAPAGTSLLASILLRPSAGAMGGITIAAGLAAADAVASVCGVQPRLKWPNDLLVDGGKLAGILAESLAVRGSAPAVALGFGVNLRVDSFPEGVPGVSLHRLVASPPGWDELLSALLPALAHQLKQLEAHGIPGLRASWRARAAGLGTEVQVHGPSGVLSGTAVDLGDDGALVVLTSTGPVHVLGGDVRWDAPSLLGD